jgi:uncharacterized protein (DUF983 family)
MIRMLARGVLRRCPRCNGQGAFFTGWFEKAPHCQTCGLRWRRGDVGFELGAAAMAAVITLGPILVVLGVALALAWPTIPVGPLLVFFIPSALLLPLVTYPLSYTVWQALDLAMRPVQPDDFDAEFIVRDALPTDLDH